MTRVHTPGAAGAAASLLSRRSLLGAGGAAAAAAALSACGSGGSGGSSGGSEIVFMNQSRGQAATLTALAKRYSARTGVRIRVDNVGPADFPTKLQSASQSGDMPDIYSALQPNDMAPYYKNGWAMDLTARMKGAWGAGFQPAALTMSTWLPGNPQGVKPGIYSAHWEIQDLGVLVGTDAFKAAGLDAARPPATTDDFIDQLKKVKKAGTQPFWIAASLVPQLVQSHASNWLTDTEITATIAGRSPWKADGWRRALGLLVDLRDAGLIATGSLPSGGNDNPTVEKAFFNTRDVAAIFDGSPAVAVARATSPGFTAYRSMTLPRAADGVHPPRPYGGVAKGAAINPKSKHAAQALKFVEWLTAAPQQRVLAAKVPVIPTLRSVSADSVPAQMAGFAARAADIQLVPTQMKAQVSDALVKGAQALVLKEQTVDQVLAGLDAAQKSA